MKIRLAFLIVVIAQTCYCQTKGWTQFTTPAVGTIKQIEAGPNNSVYAFTDEYILYRYSNRYWKPVLAVSYQTGNYQAISVAPNGTTFLYNYINTQQQGIDRSTDGGETWNHALNISYISAICYSASGNMYAFQGGSQSSQTTIYSSSDNGENWSLLTSIPLQSNGFTVNEHDQCFFSLISSKLEIVRYDVATNLYKAISSDAPVSSYAPTITCCNGQTLVRTKNDIYFLQGEILKRKSTIDSSLPAVEYSLKLYFSTVDKKTLYRRPDRKSSPTI
ncbi:MAG TPA: sialidase family protein [Candidatus Kapabacteria bacterium]|nr:sialidase family protein [Candidatus Kapabacteria bacterium]